MSNFKDTFDLYDWDTLEKEIYNFSATDVENVLSQDKITLDDFKVLISPAAKPFIEQMAQRSNALTKKRFGNTIQMYIPMYLSNECKNICTYCGFSMTNKIRRKTLSDAEILQEVEHIKKLGYDHILLVTGEANKTVGVPYLKNAIRLIREHFSNISIEVQPLDQEEYETLIDEGLYAVLVYQETYHKKTYKKASNEIVNQVNNEAKNITTKKINLLKQIVKFHFFLKTKQKTNFVFCIIFICFLYKKFPCNLHIAINFFCLSAERTKRILNLEM